MIPKGEFTLGINPNNKLIQFMSDATLLLNAQPAQKTYTKSFFIDQFEVTYDAFHRFKPKFKYNTKSIKAVKYKANQSLNPKKEITIPVIFG
mgnify:CR=1 FL=1